MIVQLLKDRISKMLKPYPLVREFVDTMLYELRVLRAQGNPFKNTLTLYPSNRRIALNPMDRRARNEIMSRQRPYYKRVQFVTWLIALRLQIDMLVDVGVNYGECIFSVPKKFTGRCLGFEANIALQPYLQKSMEMNRDLKVEMYWDVVSDLSNQEITFFVDKLWSGKSSAVQLAWKNDKVDKIQSKTISLDDILGPTMNNHSLFLKVDVEGYESQVLRGFQKTLANLKDIIGFVEFDTEYLRQAGTDVRQILLEWMEMFDLYEVTGEEDIVRLDTRRIGQISELESYHTDVFLVKLTHPELIIEWEEILRVGNLRHLFEVSKNTNFTCLV